MRLVMKQGLSMNTFKKATDDRYRAMLDSEGGNNGVGSAISRRTGIEILMDLLATLPYEDLCRYLLTPSGTDGKKPTQ
jgi:hypothetical protein